MLIFEGPDNSGKSTIASYVSHQLDIPLHHFGKPPTTADELRRRIEYMFYHRDNFIFDRIPLISEPVYSVLRKGNLMMELDERDEYYKQLREVQPILVYCRPPIEVMLENHQGKEHDTPAHLEKVKHNAELLIHRYDNMMDAARMPKHWTFDYTKQEHDVLIGVIKNEIARNGYYKSFTVGKNNKRA